jgi:phosphatidate cytidylyltransferase
MTPKLSPKKTWEGAIGGLICAVLMAQIITSLEIAIRGQATLESLPARLIFAITVSIAGQLGDLAESLIKREAHLKDASTVIPGFGGVLDLLDSLFLAAPVGWAILTILR